MPEYDSTRDIDLMRRIGQHDQSALRELYEQYSAIVYSLAYRTLNNTQLADEAMQDTFLKVWNKPENWDPLKGKLSSWLLTVTRYTAIDRIRAEQRHVSSNHASLESVAPIPSDIGVPDDPMWHDGQMLREMMDDLPEEQKQVIVLGFFKGLTHREMAEQLQLPLGTVKTRARLALQKLRQAWQEATQPEEASE
jgi:RNA polymerase sigma-70 factor (ECF subfamily)